MAGVVVEPAAGKTMKDLLQFVRNSDLERDYTNMREHMVTTLANKALIRYTHLNATASSLGLDRSVIEDYHTWYTGELLSLTPTTKKQDAAAKRALRGTNGSSAEQALRDRAGRQGRHFIRVTHNVMGVLEPLAPLEHRLKKYHPEDCSRGVLSTYGAKYKLGVNQTKAALTSPQKYV